MTIYRIRQFIQDLTAKYTVMNATSFRDNVLIAYVNQMLDKLTSVLNQYTDDAELSNIFQVILTENWALVNGTALCYTALPAQDITVLLCEIAQFVANEKTLIPVEVLMPGMAIESYHDGYDDIVTDTNLKTLLQTHVLSNGGTSLLPVKLITELDLSAESTQLGNPYYDVFKHIGNGYVGAEEYKRLVSHSALTQAVFDTKQEFELLTSDTSTLLGQLKQLCMQLGINMVGNLGKEENAGSGAYPAIINFMEYYNKLDNEEKNRIPVRLNTEINLLLGLVTDSTQNINATENLSTCIATRRSQLIATMSGYDETLNQISLNSTKRESLINDARIHFDTARAALAEAIEKNTYSEGHDHLNINTRLLASLNIKLNITSLAELDIIQALNPAEITSVCTDADLRQQIVVQLEHLGNLVVFVMDMPAEKLTSFLQANSEELMNEFIHSPNDLSALLMSLNAEKCIVIIASLTDRLPSIIKSGGDFGAMLRNLTPTQCTAVCEGMKDSLPNIIKSGDEFISVLHYLTPEQCKAVCEEMKDSLPGIIKSGDEFISVLHYLTPEQCKAVCEAMKDSLPGIIKSGDEFISVLHYLTPEQCKAVCEEMKDSLPGIIKSRIDFTPVLRNLEPGQCTAVCEAMKDSLSNIIKSGIDLGAVLRYLTPEQCTAVCEAMKDSLSNIIKSGIDFDAVLRYLKPEQRTAVYEVMKDSLSGIIKSGIDFGSVLHYLKPEQRTAVYEGMKDNLSNIIKSCDDFISVLRYLTPEQRTAVYEGMKDSLSNIIKSCDEFISVLHYLTPEQRTAVYEVMKNSLPGIIKSLANFVDVLGYLTPEQCKAVCEEMKDSLPNIIKSGADFLSVLRDLTPEQRTAVYEVMKYSLPGIIKSGADLSDVMQFLTSEQRETVIGIQRLMDDLAKIDSEIDITAFASALMSDNDVRIKAEFDHLVGHSKNPSELILAVSNFEPEINQHARELLGNKNAIQQRYKIIFKSLTSKAGNNLTEQDDRDDVDEDNQRLGFH